MYAIVSKAGEVEKVVHKLGTKEEALREMMQWIEYAGEQEGAAAAELLYGTLRIEVLH